MFMAWFMTFSAVACMFNLIWCAVKGNVEAALGWFVAMLFAAALSLNHFAA